VEILEIVFIAQFRKKGNLHHRKKGKKGTKTLLFFEKRNNNFQSFSMVDRQKKKKTRKFSKNVKLKRFPKNMPQCN
jgi:hypothetical protein